MQADGKVADLLKECRLLIFDFDGTLVDSNRIKLEAFDQCFAAEIPSHPEIVAYCHANHHTIRGVKFKHVVETILKQPYTPEREEELQAKYASLTTQAVIDAPEIPGAEDFLKSLQGRYRTGLVSSTPHEILLQLLAGKKWADYFEFVQGSPVKKSAWIADHMKLLKVLPNETVFIGDTREDLDSARVARCRFIGAVNEELKNDADAFLTHFLPLKTI